MSKGWMLGSWVLFCGLLLLADEEEFGGEEYADDTPSLEMADAALLLVVST